MKRTQTSKASYTTTGRVWTVESKFLRAMVQGKKPFEGRPYFDEYKILQEGDYKNLGVPFYWVVVRITRIDIHNNLAEMVRACGWESLIQDCGSFEACISAYLAFPNFKEHELSQWVSFAVDVLEYKLGKYAEQFAVCKCGVVFQPPHRVQRLKSPCILVCSMCGVVR